MLLSQLGSAQNLPSSLSLVGWYHFPQTIRSIPRSRITSIRGFKTLPSKQVQVPGPAEDPRRRPGEDRRANRSTAGDSGENTATGDIDQARGRRWHSGMARMAGMAVMRHRHARPQASKISDLVRSCKVSCKVFKVLRRG